MQVCKVDRMGDSQYPGDVLFGLLAGLSVVLLVPLATFFQTDAFEQPIPPTSTALLIITLVGLFALPFFMKQKWTPTLTWPKAMVAALPMAIGTGIFRWLDQCIWRGCGTTEITDSWLHGLALFLYGTTLGLGVNWMGKRASQETPMNET